MFIRNTNELLQNSNLKTYNCFSSNLKNYLIKNNCHPISSYVSNENNIKREVWVFVMCDDLSKLLTKLSNDKSLKEGGED